MRGGINTMFQDRRKFSYAPRLVMWFSHCLLPPKLCKVSLPLTLTITCRQRLPERYFISLPLPFLFPSFSSSLIFLNFNLFETKPNLGITLYQHTHMLLLLQRGVLDQLLLRFANLTILSLHLLTFL